MEVFRKALNAVVPQAAKTWPVAEFSDRLSELLQAAAAASVKRAEIADVLESHARSIRINAARMAAQTGPIMVGDKPHVSEPMRWPLPYGFTILLRERLG